MQLLKAISPSKSRPSVHRLRRPSLCACSWATSALVFGPEFPRVGLPKLFSLPPDLPSSPWPHPVPSALCPCPSRHLPNTVWREHWAGRQATWEIPGPGGARHCVSCPGRPGWGCAGAFVFCPVGDREHFFLSDLPGSPGHPNLALCANCWSLRAVKGSWGWRSLTASCARPPQDPLTGTVYPYKSPLPSPCQMSSPLGSLPGPQAGVLALGTGWLVPFGRSRPSCNFVFTW